MSLNNPNYFMVVRGNISPNLFIKFLETPASGENHDVLILNLFLIPFLSINVQIYYKMLFSSKYRLVLTG